MLSPYVSRHKKGPTSTISSTNLIGLAKCAHKVRRNMQQYVRLGVVWSTARIAGK